MAQQGFGCMGFSAFYSSASTTTTESARAVIEHTFEKGVRLFNSATFYGPLNPEGFGANLRLIKSSIKNIDRSQIQVLDKK
jgi:aryl-alcohol dehydrogenase-like predicted oxidoreductase